MTAVTFALSIGAGLGLTMAAAAIWPWRPPLAAAITAFNRTGIEAQTGDASLLAAMGIPGSTTRADLACLGRSESVYRRRLGRGMAVIAVATTAVVAGLVAAGSGAWPLTLATGTGLTAAVPLIGARVVHRRAEADRTEYRRIISLIEDLVAVDLEGGAGIDSALHAAIAAGTGRHFSELRGALDQAQLARRSIWEGLEAFGRRTGVAEYRGLAATVGIAATEGGQTAQAMTNRADTTRATEGAAVETAGARMTEHMSLAVVCILGAILVRVVGGALIAIFTTV